MGTDRIMSKISKDLIIASLCFLLILLYGIFAFNDFSKRNREYALEINKKYLKNISSQGLDTIRVEIDKARDYVSGAATAFSYYKDIISSPTFGLLANILPKSGFNNLWIVTPDGKAYDKTGKWDDITGIPVFKEIVAEKTGVSERFLPKQEQDGFFYAYAPVLKGSDFHGAIVGEVKFRGLSISGGALDLDWKGHIHVFDNDGSLILHGSNCDVLHKSDNIWDYFQRADYLPGSTYQAFRDTVDKGEAGAILYRRDGEEMMGYYAPVGTNGWYILSSAPRETIGYYSRHLDAIAAVLVSKLLACFLAMGLGVAYFFKKYRARVVEANRQLHVSNQRFRIAVYHSSNDVIEYDYSTNTLQRANEGFGTRNTGTRIVNPGMDLIRDCEIDSDYLPMLEETLKKLREGSTFETCLLRAWCGQERKWFKISFTNILGEDGETPVQAVGTVEDITLQKETEIAFANKERHRLAMLGEVVETFVFDVTRGRYLYGYKPHENSASRPDTIYAGKLDLFIRDSVHPMHRRMVFDSLSADRLRTSFERGISRAELEFRGPDDENGERWYRCTTNLVPDPENDDLMGYSYVVDITEAKLSELKLKREAERDALTGLFNRQTTTRLIEDHIDAEDKGGVSACLLIDLDRFKYVNDTFGHAAGDETLRQMAARLQSIFRSSDIIGRLGGDEFVVFVKNASSLKVITDRADKICSSLNTISLEVAPNHVMSGSVGVCVLPKGWISVEELLARADKALYAAKHGGKNCFQFYDESMKESEVEQNVSKRQRSPRTEAQETHASTTSERPVLRS